MKYLSDFEKWLFDNTTFTAGSIRLYASLIKQHDKLINEYVANNDIEKINQLIIHQTRKNNNTTLKYALRKYLIFVNKKDLIIDLVKIRIPIRKRMGNWLTTEEIESVLKALPYKYRTCFKIQYETGLRVREVLGLKRDKVQLLNDGTARIMVGTKTGRTSFKIISNDAYMMLTRLKEKTEYFFLNSINTDYETSIRGTYNRFAEQFKKAGENVLGKNINTHDVRRSVALNIVKADNSVNGLYKAQKFLGHSNVNTTFKYLSENNII